MANDKVIITENLEKRFGDFIAVNKINFSVNREEVFGFIGANGTGKSTTIRMLCGLLTPTSGRGSVAGFDIAKEPEEIKKSIGYMSQKFSLYEDLTPAENIRLYLDIYQVPFNRWRARSDWAIETSGLQGVSNRLTGELPVGWRQRMALARAMLHEPRVVFLDEPTSGVDPLARRRFWNLIASIAKQGVTALVTTHYMGEAANCERMVMINQGKIVGMGSPTQIVASACPDKKDADLSDAFISLMKRDMK